jgi:hypothetical protein
METPLTTKRKPGRPKKTVAEPVPENTVVAAPVAPTPVPTPEPTRTPCGICMEFFNKVEHTKVTCPFCEKDACRRCVQTYLTTTTNDPNCMHCHRAWEREFVDDNLTATYRMGEYKKHRENVLLDREIALMPATQYRAEQIRKAEQMTRELLPPFDEQLKKLYEKQAIINREINNVYNLRADTQQQIHLLRTGRVKKDRVETQFIRKCPDGECRGFLSTAWKCGLCSKWACPECHEIKGDERDAEHTCKPENVATAKLLAKDSRPCPGCGTVITKIEGCDQMWCPMCHVAFSWRTGQKETGVIHNPHFYEWQRRANGGVAPRVAGDIPCGGIPHYTEFRQRLTGLPATTMTTLLEFHRVLNHVQHAELPRYHTVFNEMDNQELRIQYLLGNVDQEFLKVEVQKRERKNEKERAVRRIMEVMVQAGTDILRRIMAETDVTKKNKICKEVDGLREYINDLYTKIHERMKLSVPNYKENWTVYYPFSVREKAKAKAKATT